MAGRARPQWFFAAAIIAARVACAGDGAVWRLKVAGDLDSRQLAAAFTEAVAEADRDRARLIVVEIDADRSRLDLVWMMGRSLRAAETPVAVWLRDLDRDGGVGLGAALLGAMASACVIEPAAVVRFGPGDDLRDLLPEDFDAERTERELRGALWVALGERGADRRLAEALVAPRQDAWAISTPEGGRTLAVGGDRPAQGDRIVELRPTGELRVRIDAETALGLGLATQTARTIGALLRQQEAPVVARRQRVLESELEEAERRVHDEVRRIDEAIEQIERTLRVRVDSSLRGPAAVRPYHEAGRRAAALVAESLGALEEIEASLRRFPEILRRRGPGQAELGDETAAQHASAWRRALESRRRDLEEARAQAQDYQRRTR
ncbi:MAG: hypothetical protein ACF8R7_15225 [Phycisphaerales bacterium JB039]